MGSLAQIYEPLAVDEDTIRLLHLQPSEQIEADINCSLSSVKLSESPDFEALSYTWGPLLPTRTIFVADQPVEIRENLHDCLVQLRHATKINVFWIDSLSIRQIDSKEKGHQIRLMARIFSAAERVIVWLGNHADGSPELCEFISRLSYHGNSNSRTPQAVIRAKEKFLQRSYWTRTWVIQELFMARELCFLCGNTRVTEIMFKRFLRELSAMGTMNDEDKQAILLATQRSVTWGGRSNLGRSLAQLISTYWRTECSNPRDKIYALLGLVRESDEAKSLEIDYSITTLQLYFRVLDSTDHFEPAELLRKGLWLQWSEILSTSEHTKEFGTRSVNGEGPVLDIRKKDNVGKDISTISFITRRPAPYDDVSWLTNCEILPDDVCYSLSGRKVALLFRRESGTIQCIGSACSVLSDGIILTSDLDDLQDCVLKIALFAGSTTLEMESQQGDYSPPSLTTWYLSLVAIDTYTSLRSELDARQRLLQESSANTVPSHLIPSPYGQRNNQHSDGLEGFGGEFIQS